MTKEQDTNLQCRKHQITQTATNTDKLYQYYKYQVKTYSFTTIIQTCTQ